MSIQRLLDDPQTDLGEVNLLRAARAESMSDETRHKVLAGIGLGGALVGVHAASVSSTVTNAAWPGWLKTTLLLGALGGAAGVIGYVGLGGDTKPPAPVVQPAAPVQPRSAQAPQPSADPTVDVPVYAPENLPRAEAPNAAARAATSTPEAAGASTPQAGSSLAAELEAIRPAKARLARGDAAGALQQVQQYRASFPKGKLGVEATVIEIEALVALGQRARAQKLAEPLLTGDSPYAPRVRSLLGL